MIDELTVSLLKDEHGAESHRLGAACANVDAQALHLLDEASRVGCVKGNVCSRKASLEGILLCQLIHYRSLPLSLAAQVPDELGVLGSEALEFAVEGDTNASSLADEIAGKNLLDNGLAHENTGWVTDPTSF